MPLSSKVNRKKRPHSSFHIFTGPAELRANLHYHDKSQTVLSVDLSTFHAEQEANTACRQGSADILEANRWELVIIVSLRTGDISTIKSKPFRISTRLRQMARDTQQDNTGNENRKFIKS